MTEKVNDDLVNKIMNELDETNIQCDPVFDAPEKEITTVVEANDAPPMPKKKKKKKKPVILVESSDDEEEQEVLEEGFFGNLFDKVTGRKKNNKNIASSIMRDTNSLKSILYSNKEAYRHLYVFFKLFNILRESNKSFTHFSRISSQEMSQITNQLKDTRSRRNMLATPISNSIFTVKDSARKLKFILQEVGKELKYDIEPFKNRMSSARLPEIQLESTSIESDGISAHSYEQINQIANILKVDMKVLEAYEFRGLVKQIANQIKRLCQDSDHETKRQNILTLINFFERTLNSVDHYTKMFDIVQDVPTRSF